MPVEYDPPSSRLGSVRIVRYAVLKVHGSTDTRKEGMVYHPLR
jgi:hypothetical protein